MENATKALIIVAGVFIGGMILSLGIYLYAALGTYVDNTNKTMEENALNKFNTQFLDYINYKEGATTEEFEINIQDIITAASIAYENNQDLDIFSVPDSTDKSTLYVTVNMTGVNNLEQKVSTEASKILSEYMNIKYRCTIDDIKISETTGRVREINFTKISD